MSNEIDIEDPQRRPWSTEEKIKQEYSFIKIVHLFLLLYLALHNLIIPTVINIYKGHHPLSDIHYWFIIQIPLFFLMRKKDRHWADIIVAIGIVGSIFRLAWETFLVKTYGLSWGIFSIYLSEGSTLIFYLFYIYKHSEAWNNSLKKQIPLAIIGAISAIGIQIFNSSIEIRGEVFNRKVYQWAERKVRDWSVYGCHGSLAEIKLPAFSKNFSQLISIKNCGLSPLIQYVNGKDRMMIQNNFGKQVPLRLFTAKKIGENYQWVFKKIYILKDGDNQEIEADLLQDGPLHIVKSIEFKDVGVQVLLNPNAPFDGFSEGIFELNPNEIKLQAP